MRKNNYCMFCGMPKIKSAWKCSECGHTICTACVRSMSDVGKEPYCVWWNCKSNQHIKITVKEQFEKPVIIKPFFEGELITGQRWYVEINVNGEWQSIDVVAFRTESTVPSVGSSYDGKRVLMRQADVYAEFDILMDDLSWEYLKVGTLVRASFNHINKIHTVFQGWIYKQPAITVESRNPTYIHVEAIEGRPPEQVQEMIT